jgi:hypothetical protein
VTACVKKGVEKFHVYKQQITPTSPGFESDDAFKQVVWTFVSDTLIVCLQIMHFYNEAINSDRRCCDAWVAKGALYALIAKVMWECSLATVTLYSCSGETRSDRSTLRWLSILK